MAELKVKQQVVLKRRVGISPTQTEIKIGTILAFSSDGEKATVSIPGPGGRISRTEVAVAELESVSTRFKRSAVQINPAFRQIS